LIFKLKRFKIENMKEGIHPKYYTQSKATCACGKTFQIGSTKPEIKVEICSSCHPLFTGKEKVIDKMGQIKKFQARLAAKKRSGK